MALAFGPRSSALAAGTLYNPSTCAAKIYRKHNSCFSMETYSIYWIPRYSQVLVSCDIGDFSVDNMPNLRFPTNFSYTHKGKGGINLTEPNTVLRFIVIDCCLHIRNKLERNIRVISQPLPSCSATIISQQIQHPRKSVQHLRRILQDNN